MPREWKWKFIWEFDCLAIGATHACAACTNPADLIYGSRIYFIILILCFDDCIIYITLILVSLIINVVEVHVASYLSLSLAWYVLFCCRVVLRRSCVLSYAIPVLLRTYKDSQGLYATLPAWNL